MLAHPTHSLYVFFEQTQLIVFLSPLHVYTYTSFFSLFVSQLIPINPALVGDPLKGESMQLLVLSLLLQIPSHLNRIITCINFVIHPKKKLAPLKATEKE